VLAGLSLRKKLFAIHITGDENWALTMSERAKSPDVGAPFLIGSGLVNISMWTASTTLGALLGAALPDLGRFGLSFAFTAAFIAMARGLWRGRSQVLPWTMAAAATMAAISLGMPKAYDVAPYLPSFITRLCSGFGPVGTGLRTRRGSARRGSCGAGGCCSRPAKLR